jgi:hypothetical protein
VTTHNVSILADPAPSESATVTCSCGNLNGTASTADLARRVAHMHLAVPERSVDLLLAEVSI